MGPTLFASPGKAVLEAGDVNHDGALTLSEFTQAVLSIAEGVQATTVMDQSIKFGSGQKGFC